MTIRYWTNRIVDGFSGYVPPTLVTLFSYAHIRPKRMKTNTNWIMTSKKPNSCWIKLNVDISCRDNLGSCGERGILKDQRGSLQATFSEKFDIGTNNRIEL